MRDLPPPPYRLCDATAFSSAMYPQLTTLLGTNRLPDTRPSARITVVVESSK